MEAQQQSVTPGDHEQYPLNILRTDSFQHALESYHRRLGQERVFHETSRYFYLWDLKKDGNGTPNFLPSANLRSTTDLEKYLASQAEDPLWRFLFMKSSSSRGPLACTKDHITVLFTHHQVMPSFLDHVFTFKSRMQPLTHAFFRHDNVLAEFNRQADARLQHGFNLISVENSQEPGARNPWYLRQMALYHSFDVKSGRCLWFVLKGNDLLAKYLQKDVQRHPLLQASAIDSPESSFAASLQIHLIILGWCVEGWSEYLDLLEKEVDESTNMSKLGPVAEATTPRNISRRASLRSTTSKRNSFSGEQTPISPSRPGSPFHQLSFPQITRSLSGFLRSWSSSQGSFESNTMVDGDEEDEDDDLVDFDMDKHFSIDKLQDLTVLTDKIESKLQVLAQNTAVISELVEQYESTAKSPGFISNMNDIDVCQTHLAIFFRQTKSVTRDLHQYHSRFSALLRTVHNSKALFQSIVQDKSEKMSSVFARSAHDSSNRMEVWTKKMHTLTIKTKHETVSMHVITIFTLLFLPGTFLATFFSSGVLHWDEESKVDGDYAPRMGALKLFFSICIPMMAVILSGWLLMLRRMKKALEDEETRVGMEINTGNEKRKEPQNGTPSPSGVPNLGLGIRKDTMRSIKE